jgi:hypothetical protein
MARWTATTIRTKATAPPAKWESSNANPAVNDILEVNFILITVTMRRILSPLCLQVSAFRAIPRATESSIVPTAPMKAAALIGQPGRLRQSHIIVRKYFHDFIDVFLPY